MHRQVSAHLQVHWWPGFLTLYIYGTNTWRIGYHKLNSRSNHAPANGSILSNLSLSHIAHAFLRNIYPWVIYNPMVIPVSTTELWTIRTKTNRLTAKLSLTSKQTKHKSTMRIFRGINVFCVTCPAPLSTEPLTVLDSRWWCSLNAGLCWSTNLLIIRCLFVRSLLLFWIAIYA